MVEEPKIKDLEADLENTQDLGDPLSSGNEASVGTAVLPHHGAAESSPTPQEWLMKRLGLPLSAVNEAYARDLPADILGALKLSDDEPRSPPRKGNSSKKSLVLSPVSVIYPGCWSPLATTNPLKRVKNI